MPDLTVAQVAKRLKVDTTTITRWTRDGSFPNAYKLNPDRPNSHLRIPEPDVVAFEAKRRP